MMKLNLIYIRGVALGGILAIFVLQLFGISNMSWVVRENWVMQIDQALVSAIYTECAMRIESNSESLFIRYYSGKNDTARIITRTLMTEDTTVLIKYNKYDPIADFKIAQFVFKNEKPLNLEMVDSLFKQNLLDKGVPVKETTIEYIDISQDTLISMYNSPLVGASVYITGIVPIDILDSVGVRAYAHIPFWNLLWKMLFQLALTAILLLVSGCCLLYLSRIIGRQKKKEEQGQAFVNTMTHEFKRPITGATMMLDMIPGFLEAGNIEKVKAYADRSLLELNKLSLYTQQIQKISRGEALALTLSKEKVELIPFWEEVKARYEDRTDKERIKITIHWETTREAIHVDFIHFSNVVDNLMENAFKYSGDRLDIDIVLCDDKDYLRISVKDNGWGIPKIDCLHVFDKFYRANTKEVQQKTGFGLGLAYVKTIVEAHWGKVFVRSERGRGSEFTMMLPA